jgi:hypothetical protein
MHTEREQNANLNEFIETVDSGVPRLNGSAAS